jgi:hypothetical protein
VSYETWPELRVDILDRAEELTGTSQSEFYAFTARAADRAYHDLLNRRPWLFTRAPRPLMLRLEPAIQSTVSSWPMDSYTLTLAAAQTKNLTGWRAEVAGGQQGVPIYEHVPGTAVLTLAAPRVGPAGNPGVAVTIYKLEYDLAEIQQVPAALVAAAAPPGLVEVGIHNYRVTFANDNGDTPGGPPTSINVASLGTVTLTQIPLGPPGTLARRIWRTAVGQTAYRLVTTLPDNTTVTFPDNLPDAQLGAERMPTTNTTGAIRHVVGIWCADANRQIEGPWTEERLREEYPDPPSPAWPPYAFARITDTQIRFSQYPSQPGVVEVAHSFVPRELSETAGSHEILVPRNWRWVLADGGLFFLLDLKHDNRAALWAARWEKAIVDLEADDDVKRIGLAGTRDRVRKEAPWR